MFVSPEKVTRNVRAFVVAVNPASVQGAGRTGGSARLLLDLVAGRFPVVVDTWLSLVDVEDCAVGHVLAAHRGIPGERYVLSGASLRQTMRSGWMPRLRSSVTECCVGLVFCSPDGPMNGTSVTWM